LDSYKFWNSKRGDYSGCGPLAYDAVLGVPILVKASLCETQNRNANNKALSTASICITKQTSEGPIFLYVMYLQPTLLTKKHKDKEKKKKKGNTTNVYTSASKPPKMLSSLGVSHMI